MKKIFILFLVFIISFTAMNIYAVEDPSLSGIVDITDPGDLVPLSSYADATIGKSFYIYYTAEFDDTLGIEGTVKYDSDILEFVGISTDIDFWSAEKGNEGRILIWNDGITQTPISRGTVAFKMEFRFKPGVSDNYETKIAIADGISDGIQHGTGNNSHEFYAECTATVKWIKGDGNNDGEVNQIDRAILSRYLANWKGYDQPYNSDIDGDGYVTQKDRIILSRYLADWHGTYDTYFG